MGMFSRLNPFARKDSTASTLELFREIYGGRTSAAGITVNWTTALQCTTALACARVLAEGVAQLPVGLYRNEKRSRIEVVDHPLSKMLARGPNDWQTWFEFVETLMFNAALGRGGYAFIQRAPTNGRLMELLPIPESWVTEKRTADWTVSYEVDLSIASNGADRQRIAVPRERMLHLRGPSLDGYHALKGLDLAREAIGLALATEAAHANLHRNGIQSTGAWTVEGKLDDEQHKRLTAALKAFAGVDKTGLPLILDRAAKWHQMQMTGVDAEHLATRRFQIEEVCRALRVMPIMVGYSDKAATYASAEQMFLQHVVHHLMPWVRRLEQVISRDLLTEKETGDGVYVKFSVQGLLRGDAKTRGEFYSKGIQSGWLTRNEVRAFEDLDAIDGLDEPLSPANMQLGNPAPAEPANAGV